MEPDVCAKTVYAQPARDELLPCLSEVSPFDVMSVSKVSKGWRSVALDFMKMEIRKQDPNATINDFLPELFIKDYREMAGKYEGSISLPVVHDQCIQIAVIITKSLYKEFVGRCCKYFPEYDINTKFPGYEFCKDEMIYFNSVNGPISLSASVGLDETVGEIVKIQKP